MGRDCETNPATVNLSLSSRLYETRFTNALKNGRAIKKGFLWREWCQGAKALSLTLCEGIKPYGWPFERISQKLTASLSIWGHDDWKMTLFANGGL